MASRKPAALGDLDRIGFDPAKAVAHNDAEPFTVRDVHVAPGLRARVSPQPTAVAAKRAAAR